MVVLGTSHVSGFMYDHTIFTNEKSKMALSVLRIAAFTLIYVEAAFFDAKVAFLIFFILGLSIQPAVAVIYDTYLYKPHWTIRRTAKISKKKLRLIACNLR